MMAWAIAFDAQPFELSHDTTADATPRRRLVFRVKAEIRRPNHTTVLIRECSGCDRRKIIPNGCERRVDHMEGPYWLTSSSIDHRVTKTSPGVYELFRSYDGPVKYVGRSDDDLNARLKQWVNKDYSYFKFEYCSSSKAAFEKECRLYHYHGGSEKLDNKIHPQKPAGSNWKCPTCGA